LDKIVTRVDMEEEKELAEKYIKLFSKSESEVEKVNAN
jgi:hypothetical protein